MKNYYHILGLTLESNPSEELITSCYKALVKIFHPDVFNGDKKLGEEKIRDINEAYDVLKDKKKKKIYDEELKSSLSKKEGNNKKDKSNEYQNYENFNAKEFQKDWEVVLDVYPEIEEMRIYLAKFNTQLSFQFQVILITAKSYDKANKLKQTLLDNFLTIHFGNNKLIRDLAERIFVDGYPDLAVELSRYILVIGDKDVNKLINAFFKKFPKAKKLYENDFGNFGDAMSFKHAESYIHKKNQDLSKRNQKFFRGVLVAVFFLVSISILTNSNKKKVYVVQSPFVDILFQTKMTTCQVNQNELSCKLDNGKVKITGPFDNAYKPIGQMRVSTDDPTVLKDDYGKYVKSYIGNLNSIYQFDGYGSLEYWDGTSYKGNFMGGSRYGQGTFYYQDGRTESGRWIGKKAF